MAQSASTSVTLNAFDINSQFIGTTTAVDVGGETLAISVPGIHSIQSLGAFSDSGGVAVDDFTFDSVTPVAGSAVLIPSALPLFASGLAGLGLLGWRRKRRRYA